eukprot:137313_1
MIRKTVMMNAQQHQQLLNLVKNQNNTNNIINQQSSAPHNNNENNWTYTANTHRGPGLIDSKSRIGSTPIYNQFNNYNQLYRGQSTRGTSVGDALIYSQNELDEYKTSTIHPYNAQPPKQLVTTPQIQTQQPQQIVLMIFESLTPQQKKESINLMNLQLMQQPNNNKHINNINNNISEQLQKAINKPNVLPNLIIKDQITEPLVTSRPTPVTDDIIKNKKGSLSFVPRSQSHTERTKNIKNASKSVNSTPKTSITALLKNRVGNGLSKSAQKIIKFS